MRRTLPLLAAAGIAAAALASGAGPASALTCPPGTTWRPLVRLGDAQAGACLPAPQCDPASCYPPPSR